VLAVRRFGSGPPVVALHGFTLTGSQFANAPGRLRRAVVAPDLPGHGASAPATIHETIEDIARLVETTGDRVPLLGYSQGGRLALLVALDHPDLISRLALVSATAGIDDPVARRSRLRSDEALARRIATMTLEEFLDEWTTRGVAATNFPDPADAEADRAVRMENSTEGLAHALISLGQGAQPSVWHRLEALPVPTLIVHGACDSKYAAIAHRMASSISNATVVPIDGTGHNPLCEDPDTTYEVISGFLDGTG